MENVERLEDADQKGDALQRVNVEDPIARVFLHLVVRTVGNATEKFSCVPVSYARTRGYVEKRLEPRTAQAFTFDR